MTQACEYTVKEMKIEGTNTMVELHLLDIGGQRIFEEITGDLLSHANMCVVVYDSTNPETVGNVKSWYERVCQANDKQVPGIVIGNKADLDNRISVSPEDGREIAASLGLEFFELSATRAQDLENPFMSLAGRFYEAYEAKVQQLMGK